MIIVEFWYKHDGQYYKYFIIFDAGQLTLYIVYTAKCLWISDPYTHI